MAMASDDEKRVADQMLVTRRETWGRFLRMSTAAIVGASVLLILMALFLL
jgi:hypothetical protein